MYLKGTKEELEKVAERIKAFQEYPFFHSLTCGNNSLHGDLIPVIEDDTLYIQCPDCDYTQGVLDFFLSDDFEMPKNPLEEDFE